MTHRLIKRRQLLKNTLKTSAMTVAMPLALGSELANALSQNLRWQTVRLNKGETLVYVDPQTGRREQAMAVTDTMKVRVPPVPYSVLPVRSEQRRSSTPTM